MNGYDNAGRRTSMTVSGQTAVTYQYDNANRLTQIQQGSSATVTIAPDADSRRQSVTLPNGVSMNYGYDAASQLTGITYKLGANTLGNLTYGYDLAGRRTAVGGSYARTGVPAAVPAGTPPNANNQLTQWNGKTLTYDLNGNLTSDGTNTYTWNARNQLVAISGGVNANFQYDAFGRRVSKTIGGSTQFLYDGANPVQEISGSSAAANLITGGVDEYFQRTDSAGARSFLTDALGSTLALADSTGTVQTSYTFEPFGNTTVTGATTTNSFAFTGRELDATGLYYDRARYYSPSMQRFVSEDPAGFRGGINVYAYVQNSPPNLRDSLGLQGVAAGIETVSQAEVDAAIAYLDTAAAEGSGPALTLIAGGSAEGGSVGGPIGLLLGAGLAAGAYDVIEGPKVLCAYFGIACGNPSPAPAPDCGPSPGPNPAPPLGRRKDNDLCQQIYLDDTAWCGETFTDDVLYERCMEIALLNRERCRKGQEPIRRDPRTY